MWIAVTRSCQQFWRRANHVTTTINRAVSTLLGGGDIITVSYSEPLIFFAVTEVVCAGIIMCVFVCGGGGVVCYENIFLLLLHYTVGITIV